MAFRLFKRKTRKKKSENQEPTKHISVLEVATCSATSLFSVVQSTYKVHNKRLWTYSARILGVGDNLGESGNACRERVKFYTG
jgi:hypothetical protein